MKNFVEISRQMKNVSIQGLVFERSVRMAAISYNSPISAVPTNEQLLGEKKTCAKFQIGTSKTERVVRVYKDGQTDRQTDMTKWYIKNYI